MSKSCSLVEFIRESNRIEGINRNPYPAEVEAHANFIALRRIDIADLCRLVSVLQYGAKLRNRRGRNVIVGCYTPPPGGPNIEYDLETLLQRVRRRDHLTPFEVHCQYEQLHPFTDGNGRSGRALWLWMMGGIERVPLGFLHHWYYQSLESGHGQG